MLGYRVVTEFAHLAQHRPTAPLRFAVGDPGQRLQTGAHRVGVGVVGVVDDRHAIGAGGHLHAVPRRRARHGKGVRHLLQPGAAFQGDRSGGQCIADLMVAVHTEPYVHRVIAGVHGELWPGQLVQRHRSGPDVTALAAADPDHPGRGHLGHRGHRWVVGVEDDHTR